MSKPAGGQGTAGSWLLCTGGLSLGTATALCPAQALPMGRDNIPVSSAAASCRKMTLAGIKLGKTNVKQIHILKSYKEKGWVRVGVEIHDVVQLTLG